jgi:hypothetical protein
MVKPSSNVRMINVRSVLKLLFDSRGVKKFRDQVPAVASELSCPSLAVSHIGSVRVQKSPDKKAREAYTHVGSDEHPLRQFVVVQILIEHGEVLRLSKTVSVGSN